MITVHVRNTVRDYPTWKATFDKYEQFRADSGVRSYRVSRGVTDPDLVIVDLDFDDQASAEAFLPKLAKIVTSPQAQQQLIDHQPPQLLSLVSTTPTR